MDFESAFDGLSKRSSKKNLSTLGIVPTNATHATKSVNKKRRLQPMKKKERSKKRHSFKLLSTLWKRDRNSTVLVRIGLLKRIFKRMCSETITMLMKYEDAI